METDATSGKRGIADRNDGMLAEAVLLAEAFDLKGAEVILTAMLRQNPRDAMAWFWFSRVVGNMCRIAKSLENAYKIAPGLAEFVEENKRIRAGILAGCPEKGDVKRCPFCWTPITDAFTTCPYCRAFYFIGNELFSASQPINVEILEHSAHSLKKAPAREKNARLSFVLALAYANLGKWSSAIETLEAALQIEPHNGAYQKQLENLRGYVTELLETINGGGGGSKDGLAEVASSQPYVNGRVLVVDDSAVTRKVVRELVTPCGYKVIEATNGVEAMECFTSTIPDLVVLDIIMPKMDGYEVLAAMKKNKELKDIPVIMLTARDSLMDKLKGKMSASDEYLTKPFTKEEFLAKVRKYVE